MDGRTDCCRTEPSLEDLLADEVMTPVLRSAGLFVNDHLFGLAWSGRMDEERLLRLIPHLPEGVSEIYLHPATGLTTMFAGAAPGYRHEAEFAALLSPSVKRRICDSGIRRVSYSDFSIP